MTIWDELAAHATLEFGQARMLPLAAYSSDEVLQRELETIFGNDWLCVGRTADITATGDYLTADVPVPGPVGGTRSVIVLRADDGEIRAFDNVCVHRGARLLDGCGSEARITCPYHAWVYRLDGSLVGGPYMNRSTEADGRPFDPSDHHLSPVATTEWEGFVFVSFATDPADLANRLGGLEDIVGRYEMATYVPVRNEVEVWPTNWKLLVENFMDAYHVFKVHQASFAANGDNTLDTQMHAGTDHWAHHEVVHEAGAEMAAPAKEGLEGRWRKTIVLAAAFPGLVIQLQPDWMWHLRITPVGTDQVRLAWQLAIAPETLDAADDPDALIAEISDLLDVVNSEDHPVIEAIRANVHRPQFERAPFSWLERNVYDFDRYVARRLTT